MTHKPFSQACENNKDPILQTLKTVFTQPCTVWEIGSGTGQHGCYFAAKLPHISWQPTDRPENLAGIELWRQETQLPNLNPPLALDVNDELWPCHSNSIAALFTANTLHIMSLADVRLFFTRLGEYLSPNAIVCIYGPFNYQGTYTSDSNAQFDLWLKAQNPLSGIRDFEEVIGLAAEIGCQLHEDVTMPANNRLLVLQKQ